MGLALTDGPAPPERTQRTLRWRLTVLALGGLAPLALAAAGAMLYVMHDRSQAIQHAALGMARSIGASVQDEVDATVGILETLASADSLVHDQLDRFEERARRVARKQGWRTVTLSDAQGRLLFNTELPGAKGSTPVDPESLRQVLASQAPAVGRLVEGPRQLGPAFPVRVPVVRDNGVNYVLTAVLGTEQILAMVQRQNLPDGYVVAVFDRFGSRVARSVENTVRKASPSLQALLDRGGDEGSGMTQTLEGHSSHTGFHRLRGMGWTVAVGISASDANRALAASLATGALGLLASMALSAYLAWYFSRKVSQPIDTLKKAAHALGRGETVVLPQLGIAELQEVGNALAQAAEEQQQAMTDLLRAEQEREALLARVTEALRRAEEAGRSKDEFMAMLGHELRNPLAPITNALHLLRLKGDPTTARERAVMERQVAHMARMVDDLLDVSRITSQRLSMNFSVLRVAALVEQAADAIRPALGSRTLEVEISPAAREAWVTGDEVRLAQVLSNLLGNAVKFTPADGRLRLNLGTEEDGGPPAWALIELSDNGFGMSPAVAEHAFDLFYQAPQTLERARGGLGLGLAIVRSLVEMHGGTVHAASDGEGRGSRFLVRLPCVAGPETSGGTSIGNASRGAGKVLVVDDNRDAADTVATVLELSGYEVQVAYDPSQALALAKRFSPDVALLDIGLPGMSGYQLAERLRSAEHGYAGRLVALTGYGQESDMAEAHAAGFDAHLTKPAQPQALLDVLARTLGAPGAA